MEDGVAAMRIVGFEGNQEMKTRPVAAQQPLESLVAVVEIRDRRADLEGASWYGKHPHCPQVSLHTILGSS